MNGSTGTSPNLHLCFDEASSFGHALRQCGAKRLKSFIVDETSDPLRLFSSEGRETGLAGDWYGEHAGKWLIAASLSASRTGDAVLSDRVRSAARFLCEAQEPDGYLGTYASSCPARLTNSEAEGSRTWDVWVHAYAILGLLAAHRLEPDGRYLETVWRVYELLSTVFEKQGRDITRYGNHGGLSSLIVIHPLAELAERLGRDEPHRLAERLIDQASGSGLRPVGKLIDGEDIASIGTGKIYQLCWLLQGLAKLGLATHRPDWVEAAKKGWTSIRASHLTLGGGPWGGVGRHKEVFNEPGYFSPYGLVETCSVMAWIALTRTLQAAAPDVAYADEIEKSLYNSVLGATHANGEDWAYFTFPNGPVNTTYYWACCKSSGAIALEEGAGDFVTSQDRVLRFDMYGPLRGAAELSGGRTAKFEVDTRYPEDPEVRIRVSGTEAIRLRIPAWTRGASVVVDSVPGQIAVPGGYVDIAADPDRSTLLRLVLPMAPTVHTAAATLDHHGSEIMRRDYLAVTRGPIVYAAGLIDGYKREETLRVPQLNPHERIAEADGTLMLSLAGHSPIEMRPYASLTQPGTWRSTWLGAAWQ